MFELPKFRPGLITRLALPCLTLFAILIVAAACGSGPERTPLGPPGSVEIEVTVIGAGSVQAPDFSFSCHSNCSLLVEEGDRVTLDAVPGGGNHLVVWDAPCGPFDEACTWTATERQRVSVTFAPHVLQFRIDGDGDGRFEINDGTDITECRESCGIGLQGPRSVAITYFGEGNGTTTVGPWTGACEGETPNYCIVNISGLVTVGTSWSKPPTTTEPVNVTIIQSTGGTITADPTGPYERGDTVTFTATPDTNYQHTAWGDACNATPAGQPCQLTLETDTTVSATFAPIQQFTLSVTLLGDGRGGVTSVPDGIDVDSEGPRSMTAHFNAGTMVTLSVDRGPGISFEGWGGACIDSKKSTNCELIIDRNMEVSATF